MVHSLNLDWIWNRFKHGGGYLNPIFSQPQEIVPSLNLVWIERGWVFESTYSPASEESFQFESELNTNTPPLFEFGPNQIQTGYSCTIRDFGTSGSFGRKCRSIAIAVDYGKLRNKSHSRWNMMNDTTEANCSVRVLSCSLSLMNLKWRLDW